MARTRAGNPRGTGASTASVASVRTDADESREMHVRIGFSVEAADAIFHKHGYVSMTLLSQMDDKEVENLCKVLRRPGGGTTNTTGSGASATSVTKANLGEEVSIVAEKRLKVVSFIARHFLERVSKPIDFSDVTTDLVDEFTPIKKEEDSYVFPDIDKWPTLTIDNGVNWPDTIEGIAAFCYTERGITGIPLGYLLRETMEVPSDSGNGYETKRDEMIARAPHEKTIGTKAIKTPAYEADNKRLFELLTNLTTQKGGNTVRECIRLFGRTKDGVGAYAALYHQVLGPNAVNDQTSKAESDLQACKRKFELRYERQGR